MARRNIVVIGASAGGVEALTCLTSLLPPNLAASLFVVLHVPANGGSVLPRILSRSGPLPAEHPVDGTRFQQGHIYVAPPDRHLLLERGRVRLNGGPRENGHRPAVDALFRSAARTYGPRVIAAVLSGSGDDGTAGLRSVQRLGGVMIAQDPQDALCAGMPRSAIEVASVERVYGMAELVQTLLELIKEEVPEMESAHEPEEPFAAPHVHADYELTESGADPPSLSGFTCPECGGRLWEIHEPEMVRYRCRVGHAYSPDSLLSSNSGALEGALWAALNALEEHAALTRRLAGDARHRNHALTALRFEEKASDTERQAMLLRKVLQVEVNGNAAAPHAVGGEERTGAGVGATYLRNQPENPPALS